MLQGTRPRRPKGESKPVSAPPPCVSEGTPPSLAANGSANVVSINRRVTAGARIERWRPARVLRKDELVGYLAQGGHYRRVSGGEPLATEFVIGEECLFASFRQAQDYCNARLATTPLTAKTDSESAFRIFIEEGGTETWRFARSLRKNRPGYLAQGGYYQPVFSGNCFSTKFIVIKEHLFDTLYEAKVRCVEHFQTVSG